ncbi:MAG: hypothetical protein EA427_09535 [Spirochaetaceae bacterium]|nr:MAG: hypothetical protein EA427_09535 [Spirochaetaceae bacterium]
MLVALLLLVPSTVLLAQDQGGGGDQLYAITVQVQRVFPHSLGYKVIYTRSDLYPGEVYLPGRWFTGAAAKAELHYSRHPSVPYMTVFYRNAEVSHIRLFVHAERSHRSWGALPSGQDLREEFSTEELVIRY